MTIYGHLELNTDQHKHPNTAYNAIHAVLSLYKRLVDYREVWGATNTNMPRWVVGRDLAYICRPIHVLVFIAPPQPPIDPHTPSNTYITFVQHV